MICCCRDAKIEDWPTTYSRVSINVKTAGQVMFLGHAPDLDSQWQTVVMTKSLPFTLQDMLAMKLGLRFIGQGDAVTFARVTVNRELLDSGRLSEFTKKYAAKNEWFIAQRVALTADPY